MSGFISLHRKIQKHWIFQDANKLKAWLTILLEVNYSPNKVLIKGTLYDCGRGESLKSLETWAALFGAGWSKSATRRFFELLKKDSMICIKNETKTTRLTVCNYDSYQIDRNADETQMERKRNADETLATPNNKENKENKKNNIKERAKKFGKSLEEFITHENKKEVYKFYNYWTEPNKSKTKLKFEMERTWDTTKRLVTWMNNAERFNK